MTISTGLAAKPTLPQAIFTDFSSLDALREAASRGSTEGDALGGSTDSAEEPGLEEAARQFSSIFLHMALKSMRDASFGGGILDSKQSEFYRDMFDQQLALDLSEGEGFGLTQVIVNQLSQRVEPVASEIKPLAAAQAYARVARSGDTQEMSADADTTDSSQRSFGLDRSESSARSGANATPRLAIP